MTTAASQAADRVRDALSSHAWQDRPGQNDPCRYYGLARADVVAVLNGLDQAHVGTQRVMASLSQTAQELVRVERERDRHERLLVAHFQESERLRKAAVVLAEAAVADPEAPHPVAALLTADGDLDWSLTSLYLQQVLDGSTGEQALDDVVEARTSRDRGAQYLQQRPSGPPVVQQVTDLAGALRDSLRPTGRETHPTGP